MSCLPVRPRSRARYHYRGIVGRYAVYGCLTTYTRLVHSSRLCKRRVRITDAVAIAATAAAIGEHTSNGRPVLVLQLLQFLLLLLQLLLRLDDDALPAAVRVGWRGRRLTTVVKRLQLYVLRFTTIVVFVVVFVAAAPVVAVVAVTADAAQGPDYTVDGAWLVRRRITRTVPVVPAPRPRACASAYRCVVGGRGWPPAPTKPTQRGRAAHGQTGHWPVWGDHVPFQPDGALGGLKHKGVKNINIMASNYNIFAYYIILI